VENFSTPIGPAGEEILHPPPTRYSLNFKKWPSGHFLMLPEKGIFARGFVQEEQLTIDNLKLTNVHDSD